MLNKLFGFSIFFFCIIRPAYGEGENKKDYDEFNRKIFEAAAQQFVRSYATEEVRKAAVYGLEKVIRNQAESAAEKSAAGSAERAAAEQTVQDAKDSASRAVSWAFAGYAVYEGIQDYNKAETAVERNNALRSGAASVYAALAPAGGMYTVIAALLININSDLILQAYSNQVLSIYAEIAVIETDTLQMKKKDFQAEVSSLLIYLGGFVAADKLAKKVDENLRATCGPEQVEMDIHTLRTCIGLLYENFHWLRLESDYMRSFLTQPTRFIDKEKFLHACDIKDEEMKTGSERASAWLDNFEIKLNKAIEEMNDQVMKIVLDAPYVNPAYLKQKMQMKCEQLIGERYESALANIYEIKKADEMSRIYLRAEIWRSVTEADQVQKNNCTGEIHPELTHLRGAIDRFLNSTSDSIHIESKRPLP